MLLKKTYAGRREHLPTRCRVEGSGRLQKVSEIDIIETFIQRTRRILEKIERNPISVAEAQEEAGSLLRQFDEYLKSEGLEC